MNIRNVAIIAHVDHGKTTLVDGLLKQSKTFRDNESYMQQDLILDSNDQERERGITILAKNIAITYKGTKFNIIDTPGHADFGGEVERTLNMADGALLMVDAQEGPMPQTKFVLKKALELNLKIIVVINKIDKVNANIPATISKISDLFLELASSDAHLDFKVLYAIGREEKAWDHIPQDISEPTDLSCVFETILEHIPAPNSVPDKPLKMLVTALDWDEYRGKYVIGRVLEGKVLPNTAAKLIKLDGSTENVTTEKVFVNQGLKRAEVLEVISGDICLITGIKNASIGDTICDPSINEAIPSMLIAEPTLSISIGPNTSPFMGTEGTFLTGPQILARIERELQTNVAMKFNISENGQYIVSGRGELHLTVFLETLRREGFEIEVGKPQVITKRVNGVEVEPLEELIVDVDNEYVGAINSEVGRRRGILLSHEQLDGGSTRLMFEITTRNLLGLRSTLLTLSKGSAVANSNFLRFDKMGGVSQKLRKGVLIASDTGKVAAYGLRIAQDKGPTFVAPQDAVYAGMIVGINGREQDLEINVCKGKQLSNVRSVGEDAIVLSPPVLYSLEQCLNFIEDDELLEVTPKNLRMRKSMLDPAKRYRAAKNAANK